MIRRTRRLRHSLVACLTIASTLSAQQGGHTSDGRFQQVDQSAALDDLALSLCATVGRPSLQVHDSLAQLILHTDAPQARHRLAREVLCEHEVMRLGGWSPHGDPHFRVGVRWIDSLAHAASRLSLEAPGDTVVLGLLAIHALQGSGIQRFAAPVFPATIADGLRPLPPGFGLPELVESIREYGTVNPWLLRACSSIALNVGDYVTARDCSSRAIEAKVDLPWHRLRLAAIDAWFGRTPEAESQFRLAVEASKPGTVDRGDIGWHLQPPFTSRNQCGSCRLNGLLTAAAQPAASERSALTDADRALWLNARPDSVGRWLDARVASGAGQAGAPGSLAEALAAHFRNTSYGRGTFRACLIWVDFVEPPCAPRTLPLEYTYLSTVVSLRRLWDVDDGTPVTLGFWAMSNRDAAGGSPPVPVRVEWRQYESQGSTLWDSATAFAVPRAGEASWTLGVMRLPERAASTASMILTQGHYRRGGQFLSLPARLDDGAVALSDPLIGQEERGIDVTLDSLAVSVSPFQSFSRATPLTLLYQVKLRSDSLGPLRLRVRVHEVDKDPRTGIAVFFPLGMGPGLSVHRQALDASHLSSGKYELEIAVVGGAGRTVTQPRVVDIVLND